jgi:hypothetical protein
MGPPNQSGGPAWTLEKAAGEALDWAGRTLDELAREMLRQAAAEKRRQEAERQRIEAAAEAARQAAFDRDLEKLAAVTQAAIDKGMSALLQEQWKDLQASQIDKLLPQDPQLLRDMLWNKNFDVEVRAKVLEVVLLRGGSEPMKHLAAKFWSARPSTENYRSPKDIKGTPEEKAFTAHTYQSIAMDMLTMNDPALFDNLSESKDQLPPPSDRAPATHLMHIMLQPDGWAGTFEHRQVAERWIRDMPPETRGRAMYHVRDAVDAREIGLSARLTGVEVSIGIDKIGEIGGGLQWEYRGDTHWERAGTDILQAVSRDLDEKSPEEKYAFHEGYRKADPALDDLPARPAAAP